MPTDGVYAVPYAGNAAGILYNKKIFEEHGWKIPQTWSELMNLCDEIQAAGLQPFTMGFKDTWTCLAPWNGLAVDLAPSDVWPPGKPGQDNFYGELSRSGGKNAAAAFIRTEGSVCL